MKRLHLAVTCLFLFGTSQAFSNSSKSLQLVDDIRFDTLWNIKSTVGFEAELQGKASSTPEGNLILLLDRVVEWIPSFEGAEPVQVNIVEWSPAENRVVDAHLALTDDEEMIAELSDIYFDPKTETFLGLDGANQVFYRYEFAPDVEKVIVEIKTREVEVLVEPLEDEKVVHEEPEDVTEEGEEVAPEPEDEVEAESEDVGAEEELPEETKATDEESGESAETTTDTVKVEVFGEVDIEVSESNEKKAGKEDEKVLEEVVDEIGETPETEPIEEETEATEEIEEIIEEPEAPKTEWITESYTVETVEIINHQFGTPMEVIDISGAGMAEIKDLYISDRAIVFLGTDEEGNWKISTTASLQSGIFKHLSLTAKSTVDAEFVFVDDTTQNWILGGASAFHEFDQTGRWIRSITVPSAQIADQLIVNVVGEEETVTATEVIWDGGSIAAFSWEKPGHEKIHHVPGEFPTIQAAVDAAADEDWILLASGSYKGNTRVSGKSINLASYSAVTGDEYFRDLTILEPDGGDALNVDGVAGTSLYATQLKIQAAANGIRSSGNIVLEFLDITDSQNGVLCTGGTAMIQDCRMANNSANGIYYQGATATLVERCEIIENAENGIRVDITEYNGDVYRLIFRRNDILSNGGAGILFDDQPINTDREIHIENNFLIANANAGIQVDLYQPNPKELIPTGPRTEMSVFVVNNTIVDSPVGILRGGNYRLVNNIITGCEEAGVKDLRYHSLITRNLFWENGEHADNSNFRMSGNIEEDPMFVGEEYTLSVRSPAIGAGIPGNLWKDSSDRSGANIGANR
ncbi:MAG: right-handed parallel beta-helix repeat-containing protein [Opitutales bacterium]|nr:right-handed parallel beta-helix repeat-containing protein [Opitutales bacterium]